MLFKVQLKVPSLNDRKIFRYVEATSPRTACLFAEAALANLAVATSCMEAKSPDVNGYVILPASKAQW